jgi:hypothetical protein
MTRDRADAVATTVLAIVARWLRDPVLRDEITAALREEFHDIRQTTLREIRPDGPPD